MTKDFRNVGRTSATTKAESRPPSQPPPGPPLRQQRIAVLAIYFAAALFFAGGLWLLSGQPSPLPPDVAPILGFALVVSAIADLIAVAVLKRVWARQATR